MANGFTQILFLMLPVLGWMSTLWFLTKIVATRPWARNIFKPRAWARSVTVAVAAAVVVGAFAVTLQLRSSPASTAEARPTTASIQLHVADLLPSFAFESPADAAPTLMGAAPSVAAAALGSQPAAPAPPVTNPRFARWALSRSLADVNALADGVPHHDITGSWQLESGDDFWHIAEQILTDAYRRTPTAAEHGAYWAQMGEANRERLADTGDPSTIFAGQDFTVVLPALGADHPSSDGGSLQGGSMFAPP